MDKLRIILPIRYQKYFKLRDDLRPFFNNVEWVNDDENILRICEGVIIALSPTLQYSCVKKCLNYSNISHLLLEKPLAVTPYLANDLIDKLEHSRKKFRIAYNFRYTDWGRNLLRSSGGLKNIFWDFQAHHYRLNVQTWKRQHTEGGGALRFYGIHLIALLSELGYNKVFFSETKAKQYSEVDSWQAEIRGINLLPCVLNINTDNKITRFTIKYNDMKLWTIMHPFQITTSSIKTNRLDQRIPFLIQSLNDLFYEEKIFYEWYKTTNSLWYDIEQRTL
ncbi:MAG: Gfo/Idh/MocA family oxidoreductase [Candidatus Aquirickettsiella sp.]